MAVSAWFQHDESGDDLSPKFVRSSDDSGLRDGLVGKECRFHFDGADAVSRYLDYLIGSPAEPDVAIHVDVTRIAGGVHLLDPAPVVASVSLGGSPDGGGQSRERGAEGYDSLLSG